LKAGDLKLRPIGESKGTACGQFSVSPFHWEIEYPEVFDRETPGFDGIVGNPPFLGGRRTSSALGDAYSEWLSATNEKSSNNADLAAFFFRRAFDLLNKGGKFGLIATNTISQGDTRGTRYGYGQIEDTSTTPRSALWPGRAAVMVSVIHVTKSTAPTEYV
jgi:hypothetical protein